MWILSFIEKCINQVFAGLFSCCAEVRAPPTCRDDGDAARIAELRMALRTGQLSTKITAATSCAALPV